MHFRKPMIGVLPLYDCQKNSYWMLPGYFEGITAAGGMPVMLPLVSAEEELAMICDSLDGFLFTGGQDVDPLIYDSPVMEWCREIYPPRDKMEVRLLKLIMTKDKPILGICRGLQLINGALGGRLFQDISQEMKRDVTVQHLQHHNYEFPIHDVKIQSDSLLYKILGKDSIRVNSIHHQGISELSPLVKAGACSDDGLIEAIEIPEMTFGLGVQWHPEFLFHKDDDALKLFRAFVDASKNNCESDFR
jgi:putative glutamine amidotransferase